MCCEPIESRRPPGGAFAVNLLRTFMPRGLFWRAFLIMLIPLILVQATGGLHLLRGDTGIR